MMRRVFISDDDLALIEQACRSLAVQYSADAERQRNPVISEGPAEAAKRFERLAERMKRFRSQNAGD